MKKMVRDLVSGKITLDQFWKIAKQNAKHAIKNQLDEKKFELQTLRRHIFTLSNAAIKNIVHRDWMEKFNNHRNKIKDRKQHIKTLFGPH